MPPASVSKTHQAAYCLTAQHKLCPVYQAPQPVALPSEAAGGTSPSRYSSWLWLSSALLVVGVISFLIVWRVVWPPAAHEPAASPPTPISLANPASPTATELPTPTSTPSPPPTATAPATVTPSPTPWPTPSPVPTATPEWVVVPVESGVAVYSRPNVYYPILAFLEAAGPAIRPIGRTADDAWWQVCCVSGTTVGWVRQDRVVITPAPGVLPVIETPVPQVRAFGLPVNVRTGPDVIYPIVSALQGELRLDIIGVSPFGGWWQVCCVNGAPAWVFGDFVEVLGDVQGVPEAPHPPTPMPTPP